MCFNISNTRRMAEIEARFSAVLKEDQWNWEPRAEVSGFTRPEWPILCSEKPDCILGGRWGLVPPWVKEKKRADELALMTLNARAESLKEKPSFRDSLSNRCLIPVSGFFEPHHRGEKVYPFLFSHKKAELFALGGLYCDSPWLGGPVSRSFTIITQRADEETAAIHNKKKRMPLIVPESCWIDWLDPEKPVELWKDYADVPRNLQYWPVSSELYKKKRTLQGEELLKPVQIPSENLDTQQDLFYT